ncbi:hypothetical protein Tco_1437637 [Tanacetum coccineum]
MHNNIMAAGSRDHPPMLATGRYAQWRSWFLQYIDTRPNGDALRKCILKGTYTPTIVRTPAVLATEDSPAVKKCGKPSKGYNKLAQLGRHASTAIVAANLDLLLKRYPPLDLHQQCKKERGLMAATAHCGLLACQTVRLILQPDVKIFEVLVRPIERILLRPPRGCGLFISEPQLP